MTSTEFREVRTQSELDKALGGTNVGPDGNRIEPVEDVAA